ncbi:mechanosensitive ion channel [Candidatus Woesearchaeota archaeon]|jgi:small-conductance mechanosensitive channel|nr:mechanosensitive ion channel [Candidatus Woesearchaeota archaeon]MBT4322161.1 mechanosensitive ion channel [Candidatus Woesearchaeota archaeon]MBT4630839.1 mechanosensitive ion channel [Candidatus Woesearchaeota archaeon]
MLFDSISNQYWGAFLFFFIIFLGLRVLFFILEKIILKFTVKTKTNLDDIIMKKSSFPITALLFFVSLRLTLKGVELAEGTLNVLYHIVDSFVVIFVGVLAYVVVDVLVINALKKAASRTKTSMDDTLVALTHSVLKITLFVIIVLYFLGVWGVEILPLLGALGVAGIAIALALQPVLSNIFSGASVVFDKSVSVGDLVYLDSGTRGKVAKIGLRSTKVTSFDNELFIIPNTKLAESIIQNVALPEPKSRVVIRFGVAYGSDIDKVKKIVLKEIRSVANIVLDDPEPKVSFRKMGDSSLDFKALFYVDDYGDRFDAIDEANTKIYNALNKSGIEIPFPQMDVHLKK